MKKLSLFTWNLLLVGAFSASLFFALAPLVHAEDADEIEDDIAKTEKKWKDAEKKHGSI